MLAACECAREDRTHVPSRLSQLERVAWVLRTLQVAQGREEPLVARRWQPYVQGHQEVAALDRLATNVLTRPAGRSTNEGAAPAAGAEGKD